MQVNIVLILAICFQFGLLGQWADCINTADNNDQCNKVLNSKHFMLDMLYAQNKEGEEDEKEKENKNEKCSGQDSTVTSLASRISTLESHRQTCEDNLKKLEVEHLDNQGSVRAVAEKFGDLVKGMLSPHDMEHAGKDKQQTQEKPLPAPSPAPPKKESDHIWDQLMATPRELRIKELDFTDLVEEDDIDILDMGNMIGSGDLTPPPPPPPCLPNLPPPPPLFGCPPPPPVPGMMMPPPPPFLASIPPVHLGSPQLSRGEPPLFQKKKKTIRLFWNEVRPIDWQYTNHKRCRESLWSKLDPVKLDTAKLENLFETKSKELPVTKVPLNASLMSCSTLVFSLVDLKMCANRLYIEIGTRVRGHQSFERSYLKWDVITSTHNKETFLFATFHVCNA